ncbi:MAG: sigma-54 dependent transcriptional regulator [Acidobacteria bacterium]|nr:sigma-54 dependent transcriptional regulator [Acidobacteriota bacterium]
MKPTNVLLLDMNPACDLGGSLREVLESGSNGQISLKHEAVENSELSSIWTGALPGILSRVKPAVIFLVSQGNVLRNVKSLLHSLRRLVPHPPVVTVSNIDQRSELYEAYKHGVEEIFTPPFNPIEIHLRLQKLIEQTCWGETLSISYQDAREKGLKGKWSYAKPLLGQSQAFLAAIRKLPNIAQSSATVLICGETGTGKEVCARAIHQLSLRSGGNFVAVNCGAFPEQLIESELFGHERGSFTGAISSKSGLICEAQSGTLFLDELDSLPLPAQNKLLRFLQEKEYRPVGSTKTRIADVRVIAATNADLEEAVRRGRVRGDLYFRLRMFPIHLPPLRERVEDIRLLAAHFLARTSNELRKNVNGFSPEALLKLCSYDWPGNVRELESIVTRAVTLAELSVINSYDLDLPEPDTRSYQERKDEMVREWERREIAALLSTHNGNVCRAADVAGMDPRVMRERIRRLGIDPNDFRPKHDDDDAPDE